MRRYIIPRDGYRSFNDFFTRKLKDKYRISSDAPLVSPCDGLLSIVKIQGDPILKIKNSEYRLNDLLGNRDLANDFRDGTALIFRLTPKHYHRYVYCSDGIITGRMRIDGVLHCVRPIALEYGPVFTRNSKEYIVIDSITNGRIVQMEVGAMLVGRIVNRPFNNTSQIVCRGCEKGYFEYGGSTIIVLLDHHTELNESIASRAKNGDEIPVYAGEALI